MKCNIPKQKVPRRVEMPITVKCCNCGNVLYTTSECEYAFNKIQDKDYEHWIKNRLCDKCKAEAYKECVKNQMIEVKQ